jgi:hypothetical protein
MATQTTVQSTDAQSTDATQIPFDFLPHLLKATATNYGITITQLKTIIQNSQTWEDVIKRIKELKNSQTFDIEANPWTDHNTKMSCQSMGITVEQYNYLLRQRKGMDWVREEASKLRLENLKNLQEKQNLIVEKAHEFEGTSMKTNL